MIYFSEALSVLLANKVRSILTMTGLIIGVGAVIAIQVLGASMAGAMDGLLGHLSDSSFVMFPSQTQRNAGIAGFYLHELQDLKAAVPGIVDVIPLAGAQDVVRHGHEEGRFTISPESAIPFDNLPVKYGRHIDQEDIDSASNVCVLKDAAYKRLFPKGGDPTGDSIYAGPNRFVVVGVLEPPKQGLLTAGFVGPVAIPWTTYVHRYVKGDRVFGARIVVSDPATMAQTEATAIKYFRDLRGKPDLQYITFDKSGFAQGINGIFSVMTLVVAFIGAVSLLVAGIGIMNIMLVSVAERTREIGVRKAIGARRGQVLAQFFIEALLLCGFGCGIGWAIGVGIGAAINNVAIVKLTGTVVPVPWFETIAITIVFAIVVTLAFGTYPAFRAASLDPIEALRYE